MPLALIQPLDFAKTATTRDMPEANIFFPYPDDCGIDIKDIPIFLVYNGYDHYCSVSYPGKTFKDGCKELYGLLTKARALSDGLLQHVGDQIVKDVLSKASENSISSLYSVDSLVQNMHSVNIDEEPASKKRKQDEKDEKSRKTRSGKTMFDEFTCFCGVPKDNKQDLEDHKVRRHNKGQEKEHWHCVIEDCKHVSKEGKSLKKHVQNLHFREFYHWCKYCDKGSDEKHVIENHMRKDHKIGITIPCRKLGCPKMYNSLVSRNRHEKYCNQGKMFHCNYENCKKSFKREENLNRHIGTVHTGEIPKVFCKICCKTYQSNTSFKAHLKNNQCNPRDLDEIPDEELQQIEKDLQIEDEDIQEIEEGEEEEEVEGATGGTA